MTALSKMQPSLARLYLLGYSPTRQCKMLRNKPAGKPPVLARTTRGQITNHESGQTEVAADRRCRAFRHRPDRAQSGASRRELYPPVLRQCAAARSGGSESGRSVLRGLVALEFRRQAPGECGQGP